VELPIRKRRSVRAASGEPPVAAGACAVLNALSAAGRRRSVPSCPRVSRHHSDVARSRSPDPGRARPLTSDRSIG
jgi:hypothetical protein